MGFNPWVERIPWRRKLQPAFSVFLPGESCGQRSLAGYSPWSHKESDVTEATYHTAHRTNFTLAYCVILWSFSNCEGVVLFRKFFFNSLTLKLENNTYPLPAPRHPMQSLLQFYSSGLWSWPAVHLGITTSSHVFPLLLV